MKLYFNDDDVVTQWVHCSHLCSLTHSSWMQLTKWRASDSLAGLLGHTNTSNTLAICVSIHAFAMNGCSGRWNSSLGTVHHNALSLVTDKKIAYSTDHMPGLWNPRCVALARIKSIAYTESMQNSSCTRSVHLVAMTQTDYTSAILSYSDKRTVFGVIHQAVLMLCISHTSLFFKPSGEDVTKFW